MTQLLLKLFIRNSQPNSAQHRARVGSLSGGVGIFCNLLLFAGKLLIGTLSGSVSITADAMNNLSDASSSVVTLLGFKLAEKPADADHPYGHARFEYLSALAVAAMIIVIGFELAKASVEKILHPTPVVFSWALVLVLVLSIGVKLWLSVFNRTLSKLIGSAALEATAADSRNDVLATAAVLLSAVVSFLTSWHIDGWFGLGVAGFILYSGATLAKDTISPLLGEAASPELYTAISQTLTAQPQVLGYHDLMVHDYGPGQRFASVHVEMDQKEDPMLCHEIIDNLERQCLESHNVHLVIHYDPVVTGDALLDATRSRVQSILAGFDPRLSIHDFRMVEGIAHTNLIFDIALPYELMDRREEIRRHLDHSLNQAGAHTYYTVITFDPTSVVG